MVQEYKSSDLDLFDKIDTSNPKDVFLKNKYKNQLMPDNHKSFNYSKKEILKFKNLEDSLTETKSRKEPQDFFNQIDIDDYSGFKNMYPHNINTNLNRKKLSVKRHVNEDGSYPSIDIHQNSSETTEIFQGIYSEPKFLPGGDKYLLIEFGNVMNLELNFKAQGLSKLIEVANIKGIYETLPCFASMIVHYNPDDISYQDLVKELKLILQDMKENDDVVVTSRLFHFPTVYLDKWTKEAIEDLSLIHI